MYLLAKFKIFLNSEFFKDINELEKMADTLSTLSVGDLKQKTSKELAMSAIVQGNRLLEVINKGMSLKKDNGEKVNENDSSLPSVPCYQLTAISAHLMNHLMALLQVIQDQQSEMSGIKQQMYHYKVGKRKMHAFTDLNCFSCILKLLLFYRGVLLT